MKRGIITALIGMSLVIGGQGCSSSLQKAESQENIKALSGKIEAATITLGYPQQTASEFAGMVLGWKDGSNRCVAAELAEKLAEIKRSGISQSDIAAIEQNVTRQLVAQIRRRIEVNTGEPGYFDLADVVKYREAQCLGYTQVFYITANSIGLTAKAINVLELEEKRLLPAGDSHVAAIVELADGKSIMANIVPGGFISRPFTMADIFESAGNYLQLKNDKHLHGIYGKIQILDEKGLIAYVYNNRAVGHIKEEQFQDAIIDSSKAIILCPVLVQAWNNRGIAYRNAGQIEQAISDYTRAIELNPLYPEALNNRGVAYAQLGKSEQAVADYSRAIELNPAFAEAYSNRGNVYASTRQFTRAIAEYNRAIEHNPNLAQAYVNRGVNFALLGKTEQAKKDLSEAVHLYPSLIDNVMRVSERHKLGLNADNVAAFAAR